MMKTISHVLKILFHMSQPAVSINLCTYHKTACEQNPPFERTHFLCRFFPENFLLCACLRCKHFYVLVRCSDSHVGPEKSNEINELFIITSLPKNK